MIEIRLYFEGNQALRSGFRKFFNNIYDLAKRKECRLELISCGGDWPDFHNAMKRHPTAWNILLIDSESRLATDRAVAECTANGWDRTHADSIYWMVEAMEAWFHADIDALESYYGKKKFNKSALAANPSVEQIPKRDLLDGLKNATRDTSKGAYHKTAHAPKLLEHINPALIRKAAPNCDKLFQALETRLKTHGNS